MKDAEHNIQVACVNWFRYQYPKSVIYAVPNGGQRNAIVAAKLKAEGVLSGVPDLFIAEPKGKYHGFYIEMKNGKQGRVSENQKLLMEHFEDKGYCCRVCRSFEEFVEDVKKYMSL